MSNLPDERQSWNQRYEEGSHRWRQPDPLLVEAYREFIHPLFPDGGKALDVAGGVGRHALWLARRGWDVTLVDISDVGIEIARQRIRKSKTLARRRKIHFLIRNLNSYKFPRGRFDLLLVFFYLQRELFPALVSALRPGGLLIYKTYTEGHRKCDRGFSHPEYFLKPNELLNAFPGLQVLYYRETVRERGVAELVGRKWI